MKIIEDVYLLESTKDSYAYLINGEEPILIDTGIPGKSKQMIKEMSDLGIKPKHIFLTHHDVDHVGNAKILQEYTGAELWATKEDEPFIIGEKNRPGIKRIVQTIVRVEKSKVDLFFKDNQDILSIKVIFTPGHTPGHVCFLYKKVLFAGDLIASRNRKLTLLPKFGNWNNEILKSSLERVKYMDFDWICPAHGKPIQCKDINISTYR